MELHLRGVLWGTLTDYGYDQPWAFARVTPVDVDAWRGVCRATQLSSIEPKDLPDDDAEYERLLAKLGVTKNDERTLSSGDWTVVCTEPARPSLNGPIDIYEFRDDGLVCWQWRTRPWYERR